MAIYPRAKKLLIPESSTQPKIVPRQFIVHSIVAPWTSERLRDYWNTTTLESHFSVDYDGNVGQFVDTGVRADANYRANEWALSAESASNVKATDRWTPEQVDSLADLMVWAGRKHKIPFVIAPAWNEPGFGYHRMYGPWSPGGTACPGANRVSQWEKELWPEVVRRSQGGLHTVHTVKSGDTLFTIAQKHRISWVLIATVNGIPHPYLIHPGDKLKIPTSNHPVPERPKTYTVKTGDTLSDIGERYHVGWRDIAGLNKIKSPYVINPGDKLKLPPVES